MKILKRYAICYIRQEKEEKYPFGVRPWTKNVILLDTTFTLRRALRKRNLFIKDKMLDLISLGHQILPECKNPLSVVMISVFKFNKEGRHLDPGDDIPMSYISDA